MKLYRTRFLEDGTPVQDTREVQTERERFLAMTEGFTNPTDVAKADEAKAQDTTKRKTMFVLGTNDRLSANSLSTAVATTQFSWGDPA